ncbi:apolipoprotein A-Ib [Antennarius striatus]|uniref:apolipoprotein A-Ib n=1 Tax=Antennarius striatus TaxID=241820 RepID=UPI0035B3C5A1
MKFVPLTLVLLLAVGSQARSVRSAENTDVQQMWSTLDYLFTSLTDGIKNVVETIDDSEDGAIKANVAKTLEERTEQFKNFQGAASLVIDSISDFIHKAMEENPLPHDEFEKFMGVVSKNTEAYQNDFDAILKEYIKHHPNEMEKLQNRMEETKNALQPVLDSLTDIAQKQLENIKGLLVPHVEDLRQTMNEMSVSAMKMKPEDTAKLHTDIQAEFEGIGANLVNIYNIISSTLFHE